MAKKNILYVGRLGLQLQHRRFLNEGFRLCPTTDFQLFKPLISHWFGIALSLEEHHYFLFINTQFPMQFLISKNSFQGLLHSHTWKWCLYQSVSRISNLKDITSSKRGSIFHSIIQFKNNFSPILMMSFPCLTSILCHKYSKMATPVWSGRFHPLPYLTPQNQLERWTCPP